MTLFMCDNVTGSLSLLKGQQIHFNFSKRGREAARRSSGVGSWRSGGLFLFGSGRISTSLLPLFPADTKQENIVI